MSDQTTKLPPVPTQTPIVEENRKVGKMWERWFLTLREKVNVINQSLVSLGVISNAGFLAKQSDGSWASRTFQDSPNILAGDGDGSADPYFDLSETGVVAGTYGDEDHTPVLVINEFGRIVEASEVATAGSGGGGGGGGAWTTIVKGSTTARASTTTLADDPHLTFNCAAGKTYQIRARIIMDFPNATPDCKVNPNFTGTATLITNRRHVHVGAGAASNNITNAFATTTPDATAAALGYIEYEITLTTTTSGVFSFQWAQNTSNASAVSWLIGSYLEYMDVSLGGSAGSSEYWTTKSLGSNEVRNNTTTATDVTPLAITLDAGKKYIITFECMVTNANATPDLKFGFTFSGTFSAFNATRETLVPGGSAFVAGHETTLLAPGNFTTSAIGQWLLRGSFYVVVSGSGTLVPQFAQVTAHASDVTMLAGSRMRYRDASL